MKRTRESDPQDATSSKTGRTKSRACNTCRRQKARCEILQGTSPAGSPVCHRCKVIGIECIFESNTAAESLAQPYQRSTRLETTSSEKLEIPGTSRRLQTLESAVSALLESTGLPPLEHHAHRDSHHTSPLTSRSQSHPNAPSPSGGDPTAEQILDPTPSVLGAPWYAPVTLMRDLVQGQRSNRHRELREGHDPISAGILNQTQRTNLLRIFEDRYLPWLNLSPGYDTSPFLITVCCALASRHLDENTRAVVTPMLDRLAQSHTVRALLDPQPSIPAVRALQIMSLWSPIISDATSAAGIQDGRVTITAAIRLAMSAQLDQLPKRQDRNPANEGASCFHSQSDRLWLSLCFTELMLYVGGGRPANALSSSGWEQACASAENLAPRDERLKILLGLYSLVQRGIQILPRAPLPYATKDFVNDVSKLRVQLLNVHGDILRVLTREGMEQSAEYTLYKFMLVHYEACNLVFHFHVVVNLQHCTKFDLGQHRYELGSGKEANEGFRSVATWGHSLMCCGENLIGAIMQNTDPTFLSTAPDHIFTMLALAASCLIKSRASVLHHLHAESQFGKDIPYDKHIETLRQISLSPDHAAYKYAEVIGALLAAWEAFKVERLPAPITNGVANPGDGGAVLDQSQMWMTSDFGMPNILTFMDAENDASMIDLSAGSLQNLLDEWLKGSDHTSTTFEGQPYS